MILAGPEAVYVCETCLCLCCADDSLSEASASRRDSLRLLAIWRWRACTTSSCFAFNSSKLTSPANTHSNSSSMYHYIHADRVLAKAEQFFHLSLFSFYWTVISLTLFSWYSNTKICKIALSFFKIWGIWNIMKHWQWRTTMSFLQSASTLFWQFVKIKRVLYSLFLQNTNCILYMYVPTMSDFSFCSTAS